MRFEARRLIKCCAEGVQMMKPGRKATQTCPPEVTYGERGAAEVILLSEWDAAVRD